MILTFSKMLKSIGKSYSSFMTSDDTSVLQIECLKQPLILSHFREIGFINFILSDGTYVFKQY